MKTQFLCAVVMGVSLAACSSNEVFVQDWKRERITAIPSQAITVSVCFDMQEVSKERVEEVAREECKERIGEVQRMVYAEKLHKATWQTEAEGRAFQGPAAYESSLQKMFQTLNLRYVSNDKWDCPIMSPNRITYACDYNPSPADSRVSTPVPAKSKVDGDLPPMLPDDLNPSNLK